MSPNPIDVHVPEPGSIYRLAHTKIVAAAVHIDGFTASLPRPARHHHVLRKLHEAGISVHHGEQGFLTSDGKFVDRQLAKSIAIGADQLLPNTPKTGDLFSEDVW